MLFNLWAHLSYFELARNKLSYFLKDFSGYLILILTSFILIVFSSIKIFKSNLINRKKKIYLSLVSTIFIIILLFSFFEAYFRYRYDESDGLGFLKVNERWHARHVVYNNYFFRDRDFDPNKRAGIVRIGVLGDSIAFGGGIKNVNDRFSNILEKKLRDAGKNAQVYNLGTQGYDTGGEIESYQKVRHLNFDIIVWQYFLNDIQPYGKSTGTPIIARNSQQAKIVQFLSNKSFFFDFIYWRLSQRYQKTFDQLKNADLAQYQNPEVLQKHKEEMSAFIKDLKRENKRIVVIIFPFVHLIGADYPSTNIHQDLNQFFEQEGVEVINLLDYLKDKKARNLIASGLDSHPNEAVHAEAAQKLFEKVMPLLK